MRVLIFELMINGKTSYSLLDAKEDIGDLWPRRAPLWEGDEKDEEGLKG
ncbi:hypothetical protein [Methylocella tundrae]|uniref:Uncharacterized protein n=1 Tax=Methylocella tundrae TaxID=227605 RepID=A0A4U8Z6X1_METTU|nr:hypothetical protein [Methylocella tundrae]WPP02892.1 hypothetical protein SIN04_01940 [Methylocella tundrae]VFU16523.1 protein of unknown function [Methylocella tundrae]